MISGLSSSGNYPSRFITDVRPRHSPAAAENKTRTQGRESSEETPAPVPAQDQQTLARELSLFDLATRQFGRILPRIESVTHPLD